MSVTNKNVNKHTDESKCIYSPPSIGGAGGESYGLIGHPLGHSFSEKYFAEKFQREGIDATYRNYDLADIRQVELLRHLQGFNVTIPYKQAILPYLQSLSPEAAAVGAVNTVRVVDGIFHGHNTDVVGFRSTLTALPTFSTIRTALVLGTGGASLAICHVLRTLGIEVHVVSRTPSSGQYSYDDLHSGMLSLAHHQLIVNCTPLGTWPQVDTCPPLPYEQLQPTTTLYDLVYNPSQTLFLRHGAQRGCQCINGLPMLHAQAEASWRIWQGL